MRTQFYGWPLPSRMAPSFLFWVERTPITPGTADQIARIIATGGRINIFTGIDEHRTNVKDALRRSGRSFKIIQEGPTSRRDRNGRGERQDGMELIIDVK